MLSFTTGAHIPDIMKQLDIPVANLLAYSGTLPLVGSVILLYLPMMIPATLPVVGLDSALVASTLSAVIVSFLCGIYWAAYLFFKDKCPRFLLIISKVVALLASQCHHHSRALFAFDCSAGLSAIMTTHNSQTKT